MRSLKYIYHVISFIGFYFFEVLKSNIFLARDLLKFNTGLTPGLITLDVTDLNDHQVIIFSNLITMTPGTLSVEWNPNEKSLLIHTLYTEDEATLQEQLENKLKRKVKNVF